MFIRLTYNNDVLYFNINHIEGFSTYVDYTKIWLVDGEVIKVNESPDEIFNLIKEARKNVTKTRLRTTFEMPSNGKIRQFTVTDEDEFSLSLTKDHRTCLFINGLYIDIDLEYDKAREVIESAKVEEY